MMQEVRKMSDDSTTLETALAGGKITLAELLRRLKTRAEKAGQKAPGYRKVYGKLLDAEFDAVKVGKLWLVREADVPLIAEAVGLSPVASAPAPRAARRSAAVAASATA